MENEVTHEVTENEVRKTEMIFFNGFTIRMQRIEV